MANTTVPHTTMGLKLRRYVKYRTLRRGKFKCCKCGGGKNLTVHHHLRVALGGTFHDENTAVLCEECHRVWHNHIEGKLMPGDHHVSPTLGRKVEFEVWLKLPIALQDQQIAALWEGLPGYVRRAWDPENPPELDYMYSHHYSNKPPKPLKAFPGLFWYHGFGSGEFFHPLGMVVSCGTTDARALARKTGVQYEMRDSLAYYKGTYLGD